MRLGANTNIEWCDISRNTHFGCNKVSPGCDHCYAETFAKRLGRVEKYDSSAYWACAGVLNSLQKDNRDAQKAGVRKRVFMNSMSDIFDIHVTQEIVLLRNDLFAYMDGGHYENLDFLLLTKRISNVEKTVPKEWFAGCWPSNVRLGISVVNQEEADRDIPKLLQLGVPNFLSIEPMLGAIDLFKVPGALCAGFVTHREGEEDAESEPVGYPGINWIIVGGESGHNARPLHPDWVRSLRDQCADAEVPFLFKQWGEYLPIEDVGRTSGNGHYCQYSKCFRGKGEGVAYSKVGKKAAGNLLDGVQHLEFPR